MTTGNLKFEKKIWPYKIPPTLALHWELLDSGSESWFT